MTNITLNDVYGVVVSLQNNMVTMQSDIHKLDKKIDAVEERLNNKIDAVEQKLNNKIDETKAELIKYSDTKFDNLSLQASTEINEIYDTISRVEKKVTNLESFAKTQGYVVFSEPNDEEYNCD